MGVSCANTAPQATTITVYANALGQTWEDWSWDSTINLAANNPVHSGNAAIAVTHKVGFAGFSARTSAPVATSGYTAVAFWIYGHGAPLAVNTQSTDEGATGTDYTFTPTTGAWTEIVIPLAQLGSPAQIARINVQSQSNAAQSIYYLDDIRLVGSQEPPPPNADLTLQVDVAAARKPISPYIYGMNEYDTKDNPLTLMQELRLPIRRWGGNITTRYNWQNDVANHASDWYFNNLMLC